jgi:hypothetical protein
MDSSVGVHANAAAGDAAGRARIVTATVSAVVFREILKPLAAGLGPVGETALERVADDLFVRRPT